MLTRTGPFDEDALVEEARTYLLLYNDGKVPFRDLDEEKVRYVVFEWLAGQWVFIAIEN